jgi:hypothetical protein
LNNFIRFDSRGVSSNGSGCIYIQDNVTRRVYAVSVLTSGVVRMVKWDGNGGTWQ